MFNKTEAKNVKIRGEWERMALLLQNKTGPWLLQIIGTFCMELVNYSAQLQNPGCLWVGIDWEDDALYFVIISHKRLAGMQYIIHGAVRAKPPHHLGGST